MKPEDLMNAVGDINDEIIFDAKKEIRRPRRAVWVSVAAIAACIILTVALIPWNAVLSRGSANITDETTHKGDITVPNNLLNVDPVFASISLAKYPVDDMHPFASGGSEDYKDYDKYNDWIKANNKKFSLYQDEIADISPFLEISTKELLGKSKGENLVYSPLNVYMALSMLCETTDGDSREQIMDVLGADSLKDLRKNANILWKGNYRDDGVVTSILGGSLWFNENVSIKKDVTDKLASYYYASSYYGKMGTKEFDAAIQKWLNDQTSGLLKDSIGNIETDPEDIMCLITSIYFKAAWDEKFISKDNTKDTFYSDNGDITCEFMNTDHILAYYDGSGFRATALNFKDGGKMWFLLPDENLDIDSLFKNRDALSFMTGKGQADLDYIGDRSRVILSVPKFDVSSSINLSEGLKKLGVTEVFDKNKADFSPLTDVNEVFLKKASHSARVKINEEGCEAAAYTLLLAGTGGMPNDSVEFILDRPFVFVITSDVGLPLFVGVVNEPS